MAEEILLGGQKFTAVEVVDLTQSAVVPEHKVEDGYPISDHIAFKPAEFRLTITLLEDEIETLKQLYESKQPIEFVCKAGVFENIVVKEIHITQGGSINTFRVTLHLKQIIKAKAKTTTIPLQQLQVTPDEKDGKGGKTVTDPQQQQVSQAPQKQENKSWLDSIFDWFGSLFGG